MFPTTTRSPSGGRRAVRPWLRAEEQGRRHLLGAGSDPRLVGDETRRRRTPRHHRRLPALDDDGDDLIVENEYESVRRLGQQFMFTRSPDGGYAYVEMEV